MGHGAVDLSAVSLLQTTGPAILKGCILYIRSCYFRVGGVRKARIQGRTNLQKNVIYISNEISFV